MIITNRNKIILEPHEKQFIKNNFYKMTNKELADALGLKLTKLREFAYNMGLKRMDLQYWTPEQIQFLKDNYKTIGDTELAEIFEIKWYKSKGWTKKHIEKKRRYLNLKRTKSEIKAIKQRNIKMGRFSECAKKRWETIGEAEIGEKRVWFTSANMPMVYIKTKKGFVPYNRWLWERKKGKIPKGCNVCIKEGADRVNFSINDLELLTNAQLSVRNTKNRLTPELSQAVKTIRQINRLTHKN